MKCKLIYSKLNPAVIKEILRQSSLEEIKEHAVNFKEVAISLELGTERDMYIKLYKYCRTLFYKKFMEPKKGRC